ncbi:zinc ion binding [Thelotrema lepadinum]|nr:zinc ion binding [Thelotrema lepadinum]
MSSSPPPFDIPPTMRAWTYTTRGTPRSILSLSTLPTPTIQNPKDVLVRVSHTAINPDGPLVMSMFPTSLRWSRPLIPELECSGTIVAHGPSTPFELRPGTDVVVFFQPIQTIILGKGGLAEYLVVSAENVVVKPKEVGFEEAAGVTGIGQTAAKMVRVAKLKGEERVLVNGGSTGVGMMAVQMLKMRGCHVVALASRRNAELVKSLGADEVIDYREEHPVWTYLAREYKGRPFDAIIDTAGTQALFVHSPAYLKEDGPFINVGGFEGIMRTFLNAFSNWYLPTLFGGIPRKYIFHSTIPNREVEIELIEMLRNRKLKVVIEKLYSMEDALEGYDKIVSKRARGKHIVKVQSS